MNLSIIGAGHVGLVAGACLAEIGHDVVCIDNDEKKIAELEAGRTPFYEPYLPQMLTENVERGRLRFSLDLADAVDHGEVIFLCVGTPPLPDGEADLSAVERVTRQIAMLDDTPYDVLDVVVRPQSRLIALRISEMPRTGSTIGAIVRDGRALFPHGGDTLQPGDRVIVLVDRSRATTVEQAL